MFRALILIVTFFSAPLMGNPTHVLALSGSVRHGSCNKQLLMEAVDIAEAKGAKVTIFDLKQSPLPIYDGDLEARKGLPKNAKKLRAEILESDLIIIASPEYNGSVTPLLKNAIDWASRPEKGSSVDNVFKGKQIFIISASPGDSGGVRGLKHLREILTNPGADVVEEQVTVPNAYDVVGDREAPYYDELQKNLDALLVSQDN